VFLLHGVPKTSYYWRRIVPQLTPHPAVVVPDLCGPGDSEKPRDGYDSITMAHGIAALAEHLGHDAYDVVGEDWRAMTGYTSRRSSVTGFGVWCSPTRAFQGSGWSRSRS
jgi:pimeloyl-ACP methyl ester carboxylesterase